jgi:hypothetical protein
MRRLFMYLAAVFTLATHHLAQAQMTTTITSPTYTFKTADCDQQGVKALVFNNSSGSAVTLQQAGANNQFLGGCTIQAQNLGSGTLTITPTAGTINGTGALSLATGQSARIVNDAAGSSTGNYYALLGSGTGGGGGAVSSVANNDSTLTVTPTTGNVITALNLANPNTWTAAQSFNGGINTTAATAYQIAGATVFNVLGTNSSDTICGRNAAPSDAGGQLNTICGDTAGAKVTSADGEMAIYGNIAGEFIGFDLSRNAPCVSGVTFVTDLGQHSGGYETCAGGGTAVGNDDQRNVVSFGNTFNGGNSTVGKSAYQDGGGYKISGIGATSLQGNSSFASLSGTITGNGNWTLTFTPGASTGVSPFTGTVALTSGESLATAAAAMVNAISWPVATGGNSNVIDVNNILFNFPGTSITGFQIVITSSFTGTGTFAAAIGGGFIGSDINFLGSGAITGNYMTTDHDLLAVGAGSMQWTQAAHDSYGIGLDTLQGTSASGVVTPFSGSGVIAIGSHTGQKCGAASNDIFMGQQAMEDCTTDSQSVVITPAGMEMASGTLQETIVGYGCLQNVVSVGNGNGIFGSCDSSSAMALSGSGNYMFGHSSEVPTPTANNQLSIMNGLYGLNLSGQGTTVSNGAFGINTKTPDSALVIGDGAGATGAGKGPHLGFQQGTAPVLTNATATSGFAQSDSAGTVTGTGTITSITFAWTNSFPRTPSCLFSPDNGIPITSVVWSGGATITINFASAASPQFTYLCTA